MMAQFVGPDFFNQNRRTPQTFFGIIGVAFQSAGFDFFSLLKKGKSTTTKFENVAMVFPFSGPAYYF